LKEDPEIQPSLADLVRPDQFSEIELSPSGEYLAVTIPAGNRTMLTILRRDTLKPTAAFQTDEYEHVFDVLWSSERRLVFRMARKYGWDDYPVALPHLTAMDIDGKWQTTMRFPGVARVINPTPDRPRHIVVEVDSWKHGCQEIYIIDDALNAHWLQRYEHPSARAPAKSASILADQGGWARFAMSADEDFNVMFWEKPRDGDWQRLADWEGKFVDIWPVSIAADGRTAFILGVEKGKTSGLYRLDTETRTRELLFRHGQFDVASVLYDLDDPGRAIGVKVDGSKPELHFFDETDTTKTYEALLKAFPDSDVSVTSSTVDGKVLLVLVRDDTNPGDFYLFDREAKHATLLTSRRPWLPLELMARMQPIEVNARDGTVLHGFVTRPRNAPTGTLPLVIVPHGGPHGYHDAWGFDTDAQALASRGFAVLQVNFRGSGGYGEAFEAAGYGKWGRIMIDDIVDATRWAVEAGVADPNRVAIMGASYGGYAAMMALSRAPDLFRAGVGIAGVYDLELAFNDIYVRRLRWGAAWMEKIFGDDESERAAQSPVANAHRIRAPVFLIHGGEDTVAPVEHLRRMHVALQKAGVPVYVYVEDGEAHGFYEEEHREAMYSAIIAFLRQSMPPPSAGERRHAERR
jgi:dipeptidyl aminopeptidase/acylaminoacyl peptidase